MKWHRIREISDRAMVCRPFMLLLPDVEYVVVSVVMWAVLFE